MFGYIRPLEPQLRVCELDSYKAVYCGICRGLSRRFGPLARMTLSYDFTFVAMLYAALQDEPPVFSLQRCPLHPLRRKPHLEYSPAVEYACETAILLLHEKVRDNLSDSGALARVGWGLAAPWSAAVAKDAAAHLQDAARYAHEMTDAQWAVEALGDKASVDACCDPTATALGGILAGIGGNEQQRRILGRLGYMLGRFVYLCDAVDDYDKDLRHNAFNPLHAHPDFEAHAAMLRLTQAEIGNAYALLNPLHFKEILDNIICLGLPAQARRLIERRERHE